VGVAPLAPNPALLILLSPSKTNPLILFDLLSQNLARKTLRLHCDHACALGGEIIRQLNISPQMRKRPIVRVLTEALGEDGGPLLYPCRSETDQRSFDSTCRKLHRFLLDSKSPSR
jgi:hypothetical protein